MKAHTWSCCNKKKHALIGLTLFENKFLKTYVSLICMWEFKSKSKDNTLSMHSASQNEKAHEENFDEHFSPKLAYDCMTSGTSRQIDHPMAEHWRHVWRQFPAEISNRTENVLHGHTHMAPSINEWEEILDGQWKQVTRGKNCNLMTGIEKKKN